MMTLTAANEAIRARIAAFSGISAAQLQWPNRPFTVPTTGTWGRVTFTGGDGFIAGLADTPLTRKTGNVIIQLFERKDKGIAGLTALADSLAAHLEYYSFDAMELISGGTIVAGQDGDFYQINVVVPYRVN